jgi:predicted Zn-dependent peptidase
VSESIYEHAFPNGLVLLAEPMSWLESVAFTFSVPAGSVDDPASRCGLGSFTCEMVMRGAGERDNHHLIQDLDGLGVERGESVSDAHTRFSGATVAANLPGAVSLYADILRRPHLPAEQLEAARQVLIQELRAVEDEPSQKVMIELRRRHFPEPWGRPPQGEMEAVQSTSLDDVHGYFSRFYRPNGTIVGVAGRFDWEALKDLVGRLLGDWQPRPAAAPVEGRPGKNYDHLPFDSAQTQIGIAYPAVPYRHPDYYRAWGGVGVLSGGMSSRLFTEVREKRGLCYSVYASYHTLLDRGAVFCYAGTAAERAQETLDVILGELARLAKGVEPHELTRLKARIKSALIMQQESSSARSSSIARDWYYLGCVRTLEEISRRVDELTCESINHYLEEHPPSDFTVVTLGPSELEVPGGVS